MLESAITIFVPVHSDSFGNGPTMLHIDVRVRRSRLIEPRRGSDSHRYFPGSSSEVRQLEGDRQIFFAKRLRVAALRATDRSFKIGRNRSCNNITGAFVKRVHSSLSWMPDSRSAAVIGVVFGRERGSARTQSSALAARIKVRLP